MIQDWPPPSLCVVTTRHDAEDLTCDWDMVIELDRVGLLTIWLPKLPMHMNRGLK